MICRDDHPHSQYPPDLTGDEQIAVEFHAESRVESAMRRCNRENTRAAWLLVGTPIHFGAYPRLEVTLRAQLAYRTERGEVVPALAEALRDLADRLEEAERDAKEARG